MDFENKIRLIAKMQHDYSELVKNKNLTKKAICELCCPVRNILALTDLEILQLARQEIQLYEIVQMLDKQTY
jgi:hypothetical protein